MGSLGVRHDWMTSLSCIGEGNGNPLQCSCLENPRDGGAWWAAVYGVTQSQTWLKRPSSSSRHLGSPPCLMMLYSGLAWGLSNHTSRCQPFPSLNFYSTTTSTTKLLHLIFVTVFQFLVFFLKIVFLRWTIFKVFSEFVTILFLFYVLVFGGQGTWDPSSQSGLEPTLPSLEGEVLTTGLPGKSPA